MQTSLTAHSLTVAVVLLVVGPVRAAADARHPGGIGAIPVNGATETGLEIHSCAGTSEYYSKRLPRRRDWARRNLGSAMHRSSLSGGEENNGRRNFRSSNRFL